MSDDPAPPIAQRRGPSRGFWIGMLGVLLFALVLTFAGAVAAARNNEGSSGAASDPTPFPTVVISSGPRLTTPPDNYALSQ